MPDGCISLKVTTDSQTSHIFILYYNSSLSDNIKAMAFKLGMTVDLCMAYNLWSMTLTLKDYNGSEEATKKSA